MACKPWLKQVIRYAVTAGCNRGWCSSAPSVQPQYHATNLLQQRARGSLSFPLKIFGVVVFELPPLKNARHD